MSGTADEFSPYRGAFLSYMIGGEFGFFPLSAAGVYANGYLAVRLTLSPSAVKYTNDAEKSVFVRSNTPVPFPVIKGYRIKKNGAVLKEVDKNVNFITDNDGSSDDAYEIEVLYEDPTNADAPELSPAVAPSVYPSQLAADGVLNIANAERVHGTTIHFTLTCGFDEVYFLINYSTNLKRLNGDIPVRTTPHISCLSVFRVKVGTHPHDIGCKLTTTQQTCRSRKAWWRASKGLLCKG